MYTCSTSDDGRQAGPRARPRRHVPRRQGGRRGARRPTSSSSAPGVPPRWCSTPCPTSAPGGSSCLTGVSSGGHTIDVDEGSSTASMVLENMAVVGSVNANRRHYEAAAEALAKADRPGWSAGHAAGTARAVARGPTPPARRRQGGGRGQRAMSERVAPALPRARSPSCRCRPHAMTPRRRPMPAVPPPRRIAEASLEIDTMLGGWERVTAGYLIEGSAPVLIETGQPVARSRCCSPRWPRSASGPAELAGVAVTHIHLDHAGGVGNVARAFPSATVYVHEKGARHLADPTRLIDSAAACLRPPARFALRPPRPHARRAAPRARGRRGDRGQPRPQLVAVDSPGHAKHHVGLHDSLERRALRRRCRRSQAARRGCPATLDPAAGLRPRPGHHVARRNSRPAVLRPSRWRTTGCSNSPRICWPRRKRRCASGRRRPRRPTARAPTSPTPCPPLRPASGRHRRGAQGEVRHHERGPFKRRGLPSLARRARRRG